MERNPAARFEKRGPRADRIAQREAMAVVEQQCETYVREKMKGELTGAAKQAVAKFRRQ